MERQYKDSASREQSQACLNSAEAQPVFERKFKDSGIEWIGKIPETWEVKRLKNLCTSQGSLIADGDWIESPDISDSGIRYYTTGNIGDGTFKKQGKGFVTEETFQRLNCTPVFPGDLVFSRLNNPIGRSCIIPNDYPICVVAVDNVIVRPNSEYDKRYLVYITMCPGYQETNILIARGTTMQRMSRTQLQNVDMPIPPIHEQKRIADYLDGKCGEIDSLIALQEQMIEKLKAYKQCVITEAVTKGLDPNAKLIPSGIDWISEIPEGWSNIRLKDIFVLKTGTTPKSFEEGLNEEENLVNWFTPSDVSEHNCILTQSDRHLNRKVVKNEGIKLYPIGSLIFVGIGASAGKIGYAAVEGYSNQQITALIPKKGQMYSKYFYYYMLADSKRIRDNAFFTTLPIINNSYLSGISILNPPISEQQSIASFLDEKCADIDRLIALKQQKIEALKDYKKSVIYEAVTGKTNIE